MLEECSLARTRFTRWDEHCLEERSRDSKAATVAPSHLLFYQDSLCLLGVQTLHFCPENIQKLPIKSKYHQRDVQDTGSDGWTSPDVLLQITSTDCLSLKTQHTLTSSPLMPSRPISPNSPCPTVTVVRFVVYINLLS